MQFKQVESPNQSFGMDSYFQFHGDPLPMMPDNAVYLLGRPFSGFTQEFMQAVREVGWYTYRSGFEPIDGTAMTTDSGWGCMIRTGQMLAAEALRRSTNLAFPQIVELFRDKNEAPLSIHQIAGKGSSMGKSIGEWHTPSITAHALHQLIESSELGVGSSIAQDLQIDMNEVEAAISRGPCLIWLPLRFGISEVNPLYIEIIKKLLECPLIVGLGGGRPKSSYYFFGYAQDDLLYLDPHITRPAILQDEPSEEELTTYYGDVPKRMPITAIDPCFVAGFIVRDKEELDQFSRFISDLKDSEGNCLVSLQTDKRLLSMSDDGDFVDVS